MVFPHNVIKGRDWVDARHQTHPEWKIISQFPSSKPDKISGVGTEPLSSQVPKCIVGMQQVQVLIPIHFGNRDRGIVGLMYQLVR